MDIEQLKLILQTVEATTGNAKDVAVYWLALEGGKAVLDYAIAGAAIYAVFKVVTRLTSYIPTPFEKRMRDIVIPHMSGTVVVDSERRQIESALRKGLEAK
jgi:hypothetical protein